MSDSLLIQEITDLRARLSEAERDRDENEAYLIEAQAAHEEKENTSWIISEHAIAKLREDRDKALAERDAALSDRNDYWEKDRAILAEEKRKREEAERVHGELVAGIQEAISDWATENERGEKYLRAPGLLLIEALIPAQEKQSDKENTNG